MIEHFIMPDEGTLLRLPRSVVEQLINRKPGSRNMPA
jgi:hypothetical protein